MTCRTVRQGAADLGQALKNIERYKPRLNTTIGALRWNEYMDTKSTRNDGFMDR